MSALARDPSIDVVGETETVRDAVDSAIRTSPNVALLAEWFPGPISGIEAAREIHRGAPGTTVVMLLLPTYDHDLVEGVRAGVQGYLTKAADMRRLPRELRRVVATGASPLSSELGEELLSEVRALADGGRTVVTGRERQVLDLVRRGLTNREVATALSISVSTVKSHVHSLLRKFGCRRRVQLLIIDLPSADA